MRSIGVIKGNTRSLDYSSHVRFASYSESIVLAPEEEDNSNKVRRRRRRSRWWNNICNSGNTRHEITHVK